MLKLDREIRKECDKIGLEIRNIPLEPINKNNYNTETYSAYNKNEDGELEVGSKVILKKKGGFGFKTTTIKSFVTT